MVIYDWYELPFGSSCAVAWISFKPDAVSQVFIFGFINKLIRYFFYEVNKGDL